MRCIIEKHDRPWPARRRLPSDSAISLMVDAVPVEALLGLHRKRMGNLDRNSAPVGNFKTADDKYVFIVAGPTTSMRR